jgi:hypothetical protein
MNQTRNIYGVPIVKTPEQVQQENELMAGMVSLPDSSITNEMFNTQQPNGQMVGRTYVAQSPLQSLNATARQGIGGAMMNKTTQLKKAMVERLRTNYGAGGQQGYGAQKSPQSPVPFSGEWDGY